MRRPRLRLTIGALMILVLASGLATWKWVLPWLDAPLPKERTARAAYERAKLNRQVAEYALAEYDEGVFRQTIEAARGQVVDRQNQQFLGILGRAAGKLGPQAPRDSIKLDIAKARAVEVARYAAYRAQRAKRWWSPGLTIKAGE